MKNYSILLMTGSLLAITTACKEEQKEQPQKPNVLFICIDDLRSEIGCYGTQVLSPNLDKLASEGSLFTKHYVWNYLSQMQTKLSNKLLTLHYGKKTL